MSEQHAQSNTFACSACGGQMRFDPEKKKLVCAYCGAGQEIQTVVFDRRTYDLNAAPTPEQLEWGTQVRSIRCPNCGAETVLSAQDTATACAFCGAPHVLEDTAQAGIAPESVIPFRLQEKAARSSFRQWIRKRFFAPKEVRKSAALGRIQGVYLPYWAFDAKAEAQYTGQAGEHYYVTVTRTVQRNGKPVQEQVQEQRTRWRPTRGMVRRAFEEVLVTASKRLGMGTLQALQPFDLGGLVCYQPEYLAGFAAEKPQTSLEEGWTAGQKIMEGQLNQDAREDILRHADEARVESIQAAYEQPRYKLMLLPAYLSSFTFKGKAYHIAINGQNGRVCGDTPVSPWRVALVALAVVAVLVLIYLLTR